MDFRYDGGGLGKSGTGTLSVDGAAVATGRFEHTIPTRTSLSETFDIGEDTGTPVSEEYAEKMPFEFTGTLHKVKVNLGPRQLTIEQQKELDKAQVAAAEATE